MCAPLGMELQRQGEEYTQAHIERHVCAKHTAGERPHALLPWTCFPESLAAPGARSAGSF